MDDGQERTELLRKHVMENVLEPMKDLMPRIIKGLRELNIHFPIQKIAYMELRRHLAIPELAGLRDELLRYLEKGYRFKKYYWKFIQRSYKMFDREMKRDGSCAPGYKYYQTLRIDMYLALFGREGEVWGSRYDSYIEKIRARSGGKGDAPRTGAELLGDIGGLMEKPVNAIKKQQRLLLRDTIRMRKRILALIEDPSELLTVVERTGDEDGGDRKDDDEVEVSKKDVVEDDDGVERGEAEDGGMAE